MVDIPDVGQQRLKRIPIELLPPHEFNKVGIQLGPACSTFPLVPLFGATPHGLWWHVLVDPQSECCGSLSNVGIQGYQSCCRRPTSPQRPWYPTKRIAAVLAAASQHPSVEQPLRKPCFVRTTIPPDTHWVFTILPTLAFLLTNVDSSISTVWQGPPIRSGCLMKYSVEMSLT